MLQKLKTLHLLKKGFLLARHSLTSHVHYVIKKNKNSAHNPFLRFLHYLDNFHTHIYYLLKTSHCHTAYNYTVHIILFIFYYYYCLLQYYRPLAAVMNKIPPLPDR